MFSLFAVSALCALSAAMIPGVIRILGGPAPRARRHDHSSNGSSISSPARKGASSAPSRPG